MVYIFSQTDSNIISTERRTRVYLKDQTEFICEIKTGVSKNTAKKELQQLFDYYSLLSNDPIHISIMSDRTFYHKYSYMANITHLANWKKYDNIKQEISKANRLSNTLLTDYLEQLEKFDYSNDNVYSFWIK